MAIIYNSISDEIRRKCENNDNLKAFICDLFKLYKPSDKNKEGENLFTIFLKQVTQIESNIKMDSPLVLLFLENKFKLQINKINAKQWDVILDSLISTNTLNALPKYLSEKSDYSYLLIPTIRTKQLMQCLYKKTALMYNDEKKFNILNHIFDKDLKFTSKKQVLTYVDEMSDILIKLFINKNLKLEHLDILEKAEFVDTFKCCTENKIEHISRVQHINSIIGNSVLFTQSPKDTTFNAEEYLKKLKTQILSELLKDELPVNKQVGKAKKTNKI
jgi:hypothetical protein